MDTITWIVEVKEAETVSSLLDEFLAKAALLPNEVNEENYEEVGALLEEILAVLLKMAESDVSTVTVSDLHFLADGGRIPKGLAAVGSMLRVLPTVVRREDGQSLDTLAVSRTWKGAFGKVAAAFDKKGMDASNVIYILHADCEENAAKARSWFAARYPDSEIVVLDLCPMFMVHGGPGCLALETVKKA